MLPDSFAATPPPPPPPPPPPRARTGLVLAVIGLVVVLAVGAVLAVVLLGGEDTTAASSTSTTEVATTTSTSTSTSAPTTTTDTIPVDLGYTEEELSYFAAIAGQAEYATEGGVLHKWVQDLRIAVYGDPTSADRAALGMVVADLNALTGPIQLGLADANPNVEIHFVPEAQFASIEPNYVPGNKGFVYIWWDGAGAVTRGRVLISTTGLTAEERAHLIREELTQGLGLLADSWEYPDSLYYQGWTDTTAFAPIDEALIEMLYRPELVPGMSVDAALAILATLDRY